MRRKRITELALLLLICVVPWAIAQEAAEEAAVPACSDCHEQAAAFVGNPHTRGKLVEGSVPNAVCESCHGSGTAHIEGGGDKEAIVVPKGRTGSDGCLECHGTVDDQKSRHAGVHANTELVNCLSCHSIHKSDPSTTALLVKKQLELCASCHSNQAASFRARPFAHRLGRGGMECSSCHDPHGRPQNHAIKLTKAGEQPCLGCHTNLRGPFVFQHGSVQVGDCATCHEPHGSTNPRELKRSNVYQLCLECHSTIGSAATLGSQPPSFHNLMSARYQNCTTCHVAVHGSNRSPQLLK